MQRIVIEGQKSLRGTTEIQGAKNAAQKMLPATVVFPGTYLLKHLPCIGDTRALLHILRFLGAEITFLDPHTVRINTEHLVPREISPAMTATSTGTFLFAGALLSRFGHARVWHPGGDQIGQRRVTWHLDAFRRFGASVHEEKAFYEVHARTLQGNCISFSRPTANGTINAILTAMRASGTTTITNVAPEPEIENTLHFFHSMGGQIHWVSSNTLEVEGVTEGTGKGEIEIIPDRNDAATFLLAGVLGGGPVTLENIRQEHLHPLLELLQQMNVSLHVEAALARPALTVTCEYLRPLDLQVTTRPFPGFSSDWGAMFQVVLTQLPGTHVFHETVFARRFAQVPELVRMGARIELLALPADETLYNFDADLIAPPAHAIQIIGPAHLHGATVHANDVRAGAALVLAGLIATGQTVVTGVEQIERGYEAFAERLQHLGATVTLEEDEEF